MFVNETFCKVHSGAFSVRYDVKQDVLLPLLLNFALE
jgi:hypothetical protein